MENYDSSDIYDLIDRLQTRANIRRSIPTRKSVQNNEPDRIADLLEDAAFVISKLNNRCDILHGLLSDSHLNSFDYEMN